jgi:hypothetical protein
MAENRLARPNPSRLQRSASAGSDGTMVPRSAEPYALVNGCAMSAWVRLSARLASRTCCPIAAANGIPGSLQSNLDFRHRSMIL